MDDLIKIEETEGKKTVNARELWEFLQSKQEFSNWIKKRIKDFDFIENIDFVTIDKKINRQILKDYHITLDMAKELSMVERNEKGKQARRYFIECEKNLKEINGNMSPAEFLVHQAQMFLELERKQKETEKRMALIEAKQETSQSEYFTIAGYCSLKNIKASLNSANILGRKCSKLSRELDYDIGKINDQRYGQVNTYHIDVLTEIIS